MPNVSSLCTLLLRVAFGCAILAGLLSVLALVDWYAGWGLCGGKLCQDPRWRELGSIGSVPIALPGVLFYGGLSTLLFARSESRVCAVSGQLLAGFALGAHAYLLYVQQVLLHAWCMLCVITAILGIASGLALSGAELLKQGLRIGLPVGLGSLLPVLIFYGLHRDHFRHQTDEVYRPPDGAAVYRPNPQPDVDADLVLKMRACKARGPLQPALCIERFTDLACARCKELEEKIWPQVEQMLLSELERLQIVERLYLLEGHPTARKAASTLLGTCSKELYAQGHARLVQQRELWVKSGAIDELLRAISGFEQPERFRTQALETAARAVLREDVLRAEQLKIPGVPCVAISQADPHQPSLVIKGLQSAYTYYSAILNALPRAETSP